MFIAALLLWVLSFATAWLLPISIAVPLTLIVLVIAVICTGVWLIGAIQKINEEDFEDRN